MGDIDKNRPDLPDFKKEMQSISSAIGNTYQEILDYLVNKLTDAGLNVSQRDLAGKVTDYLDNLEEELQELTYKAVSEGYKSGEAQHLIALFEDMSLDDAKQFVDGTVPTNWMAGIPVANYARGVTDEVLLSLAKKRLKQEGFTLDEAKKLLTPTKMRERAVRALYSDTYGDILLATGNTKNAVKKVIRETVRDVVQYQALLDRDYISQAEELRKRLTKKGLSERIVKDGFVGVVDRSGRRWDVGTYSDMVVRTKTNQAFRQGEIDFAEQSGMDLAVISSHGAKDMCSRWEGVVISLTGNTEGYPSLHDVTATNEVFHPNCQHKLHVIRGVERLNKIDAERHERKVAQLGDIKSRKYVRKK